MHIRESRYVRTSIEEGDKRTVRAYSESSDNMDESSPVTFLFSQSFLSLPKWGAYKNGSISLKFRTNEGNGVLIFSHGIRNTAASDDFDSNYDYFAIELLSGHVFLLMNMGSGAMKVKASNRRVDDSNWHTVRMTRDGRTGRVSVDDNSVAFIAPASATDLDLEGSLFVGAVGTTGFLTTPSATRWPPAELWSASLGHGFVGCLQSLVLNGVPQDLSSHAHEQDSGGVRVGCDPPSKSHCHTVGCHNQGTCAEGWNRRICLCASTGYSGPNCARESLILSFNGDQYFKLALPHESVTQAEDLYIRFRSMKSSGLLLAATSQTLVNFLVISLDSGRLKVALNLGEGSKVAYIGYNLNDDLWHSLKIERRGPWLEIKLDALQQVAELSGMLITMKIDAIYLGSLASHRASGSRSVTPLESSFVNYVQDIPNFAGQMQSFIFNGKDYIELSRSGQIEGIFNSTAEFDLAAEREQLEYNVVDAVTFKSKWTFVALEQMSAYSQMSIYFQFKTLSANGLILFNAGKGSHFVAVELENGNMVYSFNLGDGARRLFSRSKNLNDNNWHSVSIIRSIFNHHSLRVDDQVDTLTYRGVNTHLILRGLLYFGGAPSEVYFDLPNAVKSSNGFEGCFANIALNHEVLDPTSPDQVVIGSTLVSSGCSYASFSSPTAFVQEQRCPLDTCYRRGVCVQYAANQFACDCDQSSFTGSSCSEEGVSFRFGHVSSGASLSGSFSPSSSSLSPGAAGSVTVNFPDGHQIDTKSDTLTFGIITTQEDSVILRVDSATTSDYMELQVVEGKILMMYNLGNEDHSITDPRVNVSDNRYHVVRFTRSGANATLQIDQHNPVSRSLSGRKQMAIFDTLATIQIGSRSGNEIPPSPAAAEPNPFQGIISGLTFNGMMVLDLAAENDERITTAGDVFLVHQLPKRFNPSNIDSLLLGSDNRTRTPESHYFRLNDVHDELILSKERPQFCWSDSHCRSSASAPDDLITSFLTTATSITPPVINEYTTPSLAPAVDCEHDDDEEECAEGSGDDAESDDEDEEPVVVTPKVNSHVIFDEQSTTTTRHRITEAFELPPTSSSTTTTSTTERPTTTTRRLPKTTAYIDPKDLEQSYRPHSTSSRPSYPRNRPEINEVPKPAIKKPGANGTTSDKALTGKDKSNQHHVSKTLSSVDRKALTIVIVTTIIIVIVFTIPIILFAKLRMSDQFGAPSPHITGQMIYSQSGLGQDNMQGCKTMAGQYVLPPVSATAVASNGSLLNPVGQHQQLHNQLHYQLQQQAGILSPGPTSILKKKKDPSLEWYV